MSKINPDTLRDLFLAVMTGNPDFEYVNGEQPFVIKYKGQRYHIYMIKLTSAYFKSRPDTTRAQLNRRVCFDEIKKSSDPFIFLGYDSDNDVLVCWNNKIAKARLNEKSTVSFYSRKIYQDQIILGEPKHFKLKNGDQPYFFKRKDLPLFLDKVNTLFPDIAEIPKQSERREKELYSTPNNNAENHLNDVELLALLKPMLVGPAKRTLEAVQTMMNYLRDRYDIHISMRECTTFLKTLHFDIVDGYVSHQENLHNVAEGINNTSKK